MFKWCGHKLITTEMMLFQNVSSDLLLTNSREKVLNARKLLRISQDLDIEHVKCVYRIQYVGQSLSEYFIMVLTIITEFHELSCDMSYIMLC